MCFEKVDPCSMDAGWLPGVAVNRYVLTKFAEIFGFSYDDAWCLLFYLRHFMPFEEAAYFMKLVFPKLKGWGPRNIRNKVNAMCLKVRKEMHKVIAMWPEVLEHKDNVVEGIVPGLKIVALTDTVPITVVGALNYNHHYKRAIVKMLVITSVTGHIVAVSECFGGLTYDSHIWDACVDDSFLKATHCVLGDCHFATTATQRMITPVDLRVLKKALKEGKQKKMCRQMHMNEAISHVRARVEHCFSKQFVGRFAFIRNPHKRESHGLQGYVRPERLSLLRRGPSPRRPGDHPIRGTVGDVRDTQRRCVED